MKALDSLFVATTLSVIAVLSVAGATAQGQPEAASEVPILAVGFGGEELSLHAYSRTGERVFDAGPLFAPSWAPDGLQFAAFKSAGRSNVPVIVQLDGTQRPLFPSPPDVHFLYRPLWSPNGDDIALIMYSRTGFELLIVDPETADIISKFEVSEELTADFPFYTAGFDRFSWSPDGEKILLSWGGVLVFDTNSRKVEIASKEKALAFWSPASDAVCLLKYFRAPPKNPTVLTGLQRVELGTTKASVVATAKDLEAAGLRSAKWLITGRIALSPDGRNVAVSLGQADQEADAVKIFETSENCIADLNAPSHVIPTSLVAVMDWSPNGNALAVIEAGETRFETRVIDIGTGRRVKLNELDFKGTDVDVLGLLGMLSWSH